MSKGTGITYVGPYPTYAFKRTLGTGTFISLDELFQLFGKHTKEELPSIHFLRWFVETKLPTLKNFKLEIMETEFSEDGLYLPAIERVAQEEATAHKAEEEASLKSTQIVLKEEFSEAERPPIPGKVTLTSSPVQVSESVEDATADLVEQAKSIRQPSRGHRGFIQDNRPDKPVKVEKSTVITGDSFKKNSSQASTAVVLDANHKPVGVEAVKENMKFANTSVRENTFVANPPVTGHLDVAKSPVVNYGGNKSRKEKPKMETTAQGESIGDDNVMNQPAMTAVENLKQPVSLDRIVRNPSENDALEAVQKCKDYHLLKAASKQLRQLGNKPKLEKAVELRLRVVPPGAVA